MALLNFKKQFVEPIRAGTKHHTIRAWRKYPVKKGELLYLYCGARTKSCFRILPEPVPCTRAEPIDIELGDGHRIYIAGVRLSQDECSRLAVADGFPDFPIMMAFWEGRLPFEGQIIHWK